MTVPQVQITARDHYLLLPDPLPLNGAIAICAVLYRESGLRPGSQGVQPSERGGVLNPRGAFGLASWNGPRQGDLKDFCDKRGLPYDSLEAQLDFVLHEMANGYPLSWAAIRSAAQFVSIIRTIVEDYERPKAPEPEIADAIRIAIALTAVPLPVPGAPRPLPSVPGPKLPPDVPRPPAPFPGLPPVASGPAGRIAAMAEFLHKGRDARIAELLAADPEIQWYDATLATLGSVQPATLSTPALPSPSAGMATTQGPQMSFNLPPNFKTTAAGLIAAASTGIGTAFPQYQWITNLLTPLALGALGMASKDFNVTGGTKPATNEAKTRV